MAEYIYRVKTLEGQEHQFVTNTQPDQCPICHHNVEPIFCWGIDRDEHGPYDRCAELVFRCPRRDCRSLFIAYYANAASPEHRFSAPETYMKREFSESIKSLTPDFCQIFNEAAEAESRRLPNVAGPGYRKGLEFLIKDFVVSEKLAKREDVNRKLLGQVIKDHVTDPNVKVCAERAAWLGNDETHYERKWTDHDLSDLKNLIRLSENWIENVLLTRQYRTSMETGKT